MKGNRESLRNLILYEAYVRNHGPNGSFNDVTEDLGRIKELGVDVVWLMPIHPIGKTNKKGSLGCPYSIQDYRKVNPEYGTLMDFQNLIKTAHSLGLRIMIDVVYNHTSHDSVLVSEHPEFFHQDKEDHPVSTVPEWSDVIDLKYPNPALEEFLIESLCYWVEMGVDGFRCDVASIVPMEFWQKAKSAVEEINPDVIWLAESVHTSWVIERREQGLVAQSDSELYPVFDITYDYDIWPLWQAVVSQVEPIEKYLDLVRFQKGIYPLDFIKMRFVENHDNPRVMAMTNSEVSARAWAAFQILNQGAFLMYAGQESGEKHTPSLFDVDKVEWGNYHHAPWYKRLFSIKKQAIFVSGHQHFLMSDPMIQSEWINETLHLICFFNVNEISDPVPCNLPDSTYCDLVSGKDVLISNGKINMKQIPVFVFSISPEIHFNALKSTWL